MALTGRAGLLALVGVLVVGFLLPSGWGVLALAALLATLVAVDLVLAGSVRALVLGRGGDRSVRLGERATVTLLVTNLSGRRVRGFLRDAWPPSAGAVTTRHRVDVPPGERRRIDTVLKLLTPTLSISLGFLVGSLVISVMTTILSINDLALQ